MKKTISQLWEEIFKDYDILKEIDKKHYYKITADQIRKYKEPRLMAKFDFSKQLPKSFKENNLGILPIKNLIENLLWTLLNDTKSENMLNQTTMGLLFLQLMDHTDKLSYNNSEKAAVLNVFRYIDENYKNGSLTEAANLLHYDFYWLSREVKRKTGKTFTDLLQEKRLLTAAELLTTTDMTVLNVADAVGYDNVSYFHRIFKKQFTVSPKEYRNCK